MVVPGRLDSDLSWAGSYDPVMPQHGLALGDQCIRSTACLMETSRVCVWIAWSVFRAEPRPCCRTHEGSLEQLLSWWYCNSFQAIVCPVPTTLQTPRYHSRQSAQEHTIPVDKDYSSMSHREWRGPRKHEHHNCSCSMEGDCGATEALSSQSLQLPWHIKLVRSPPWLGLEYTCVRTLLHQALLVQSSARPDPHSPPILTVIVASCDLKGVLSMTAPVQGRCCKHAD